jgi:transposase
MHDKELYQRILGIEAPWTVVDVELDSGAGEVRVHLVHGATEKTCPECGKVSCGYDSRPRRWRHLDTCQYRTILIAEVPRIECPDHGVLQVRVPWGEPGSRFTAMFEALVIDWLQEASISAVARQLRLSWDGVDAILGRAVRRGLRRRRRALPVHQGVDETSFKRRHEYVTVVSDQDRGVVVHVADGRGREVLDSFYQSFTEDERTTVEAVAMDMWQPFIASTLEHLSDGARKICFDKFHVASHLSEAVDKVRRQESRALLEGGDSQLKGSKYLWLRNPENFSAERWESFAPLRASSLKTARAWAIKELGMQIWRFKRRAWAHKAWLRWYSWAIRSRLEPVKKVARMIKRHLEGILNAIVRRVTNARAEGINAKIQWIKYTARGFRNRERFHNAIYFHLGGLDLYPEGFARPQTAGGR